MSKNQFEPSDSQFQQQVKTILNWSDSTISKNQFELVTASFNNN